MVAIPTAGMVRMGFAYSLAAMIAKVAAQGVPTRPEATVNMMMDVSESSCIHSNREALVQRAIDRGNTHLMFLDDDMVFEPQVLDIMLGRRQKVVATNYAIKTTPFHDFVAVSLEGQRIVTHEHSTGLVPIAYSGFGVSVFEVDVFKNVPQPWFCPEWDDTSRGYTTEDNPCYRKIRESGVTCYLDQDASKLVSHIGVSAWTWQQWVPRPKQETQDGNE